ncbi:MAG: peptide chain release factor 1 [Candidatus Methylomirabilales bacterium]
MVTWLDKLRQIEERYESLSQTLADPSVLQDLNTFQRHAKAHADLRPLVEKYRAYRRLLREHEEAATLLEEATDSEMRTFVEGELKALTDRQEVLERELQEMLVPRDPADEKGVIMEIRAGAGGGEAALFAADLLRMYTRYAESESFKVEMLSAHPTGIGGMKEVILAIEGKGVFGRLRHESGVHRVQRVPATEASGRIHTSTVTIAVLPEAEEVDVHVDPKDLQVDVFRASGHGGQHVNVTDSAVRITHVPSGLVVSCQDERSQHKNKAKALKVLRARLLERARAEQEREIADVRRQQVGTGDRSERIRTYNFPQGRVTDHRIGLTLYNLPEVLDGNLTELTQALMAHGEAERLKTSSAS